jgi:rod shape-determining protein MreB and related proteins
MRSNGRLGLMSRLSGIFSRDLGIDLGTANTLVHVSGKGVVLREPSVVAMVRETGVPLYVGTDAKRLLGRTPPNILAMRPLQDGVIADFDPAQKMLEAFISRVAGRTLFRRNVLIGIPTGATEVERLAVKEAAERAGANRAFVVEEPLAAAFGAGLPVFEPTASMIVDIGGGTTEVAVISMSGIVHARSIRIAGDELDEAIVSHIRRAYNLYIGERTAEETKIAIGSVVPLKQELEIKVRGRDLVTGLPRAEVISSEEVRAAIMEPVYEIVESVKLTLESTPQELAGDVMERGITLCGGGALLRGLDRLIARETLVPVHIAQDPLGCVAAGTGIIVERMHDHREIRKLLEKVSRN